MNSPKIIPHKYSLLQIFYWMLYCVGYSYVTFYLLHQGFSASQIGILTAAFGTIAAILQPLLGRLADCGGKTGWKPQLIFMYSFILVCMIGLLYVPNSLSQGLLYGLFLMLLSCIMPMVNYANFYYVKQGISIRFGLSRGLGSLFYAVMSYLIGKATVNGDVKMLIYSGIILSVFSIVLILTFPYKAIPSQTEASQAHVHPGKDNAGTHDANKNQTVFGFFHKYPSFGLTLVGFILCLMFHNISNTYLLQMMEAVGGTSENYGFALSISAILELPAMFGFVYLNRRFSLRTLLSTCGIAFALKSAAYLISTNVSMMYGTQIFQAFAFALFIPASVYFAEHTMQEEDKAKGQAFVTSSITVASVFGNLLGGFWLDRFGITSMLVMTLFCATCGALIIIISQIPRKQS